MEDQERLKRQSNIHVKWRLAESLFQRLNKRRKQRSISVVLDLVMLCYARLG